MRPALLLAGVAVVSSTALAQTAAAPSTWRFGAEVSAPARILSNGSNHMSLGIGEALEAERFVGGSGATRAAVILRVGTAAVNGTGDSNDWNPGQAFIADVAVRAEHSSPKLELFIGGGISHWSGPASVSPFSGAAAALLSAEVGGAIRHGTGPWRFSATAHATKFGPNDDRGVVSGTVLRFMLGVQRDY
jgi:hypothetical protein